MKSYCIREKKITECVPNSERYEKAKNGRLMLKCQCMSCGITKSKFVKNIQGDGIAEALFEAGVKGSYNLGKIGLKKMLESDATKKMASTYVKNITNKYIDQGVDSTLDNLSSKIHTSRGGAVDIHKMIGYLPKPKGGFTPKNYKYMGPYNPLDKQLEYDKNTGEVTKWHVKPYNKVDEIAAAHDICYDMGKSKGECDKKMVSSLDQIPYGEMPKWGQTARFLINTKQKLGLGVKSKNGKSRRVGKKN